MYKAKKERGRGYCKVEEYDVVVIGGGPAGMAAALGAGELRIENGKLRISDAGSVVRSEVNDLRSVDNIMWSCERKAKLRVLIVERASRLGGILNQCTHSGFGLSYFGEELTGQEYARRFVERVRSSEIEVLLDTMVMDISPDRVITVSGTHTGFRQLSAKAVVLATGCRERPIGALPVIGSRPSGIFTAGAAQKMINLGGYDLGNRFVILGSGDVGLIVARELAKRSKEVLAVIEKEAACGGLPRNRVNCLENYGIPLITCATVSRVHGMPRVSGVTVMRSGAAQLSVFSGQFSGDEDTGRLKETFIECDTLITSVGLVPERELVETLEAPTAQWSGVRSQGSGDEGMRSEAAQLSVVGGQLSGDDGAGIPEWLFVCGNADYVHAIVDGVTIESERIGHSAAQRVWDKSPKLPAALR